MRYILWDYSNKYIKTKYLSFQLFFPPPFSSHAKLRVCGHESHASVCRDCGRLKNHNYEHNKQKSLMRLNQTLSCHYGDTFLFPVFRSRFLCYKFGWIYDCIVNFNIYKNIAKIPLLSSCSSCSSSPCSDEVVLWPWVSCTFTSDLWETEIQHFSLTYQATIVINFCGI